MDELRNPTVILPNGSVGMPLEFFQFTREELSLNPDIAARLVPAHMANEVAAKPLPYFLTTSHLPTVAEVSS